MALLACLAVVALTQGPALVLKGLDPVLLLQGKEVPGLADFSENHLRYTYRFSSKENQQAFRKDPLKFAVQNGGACGKMGELTGRGSPDRWYVAQGKIFIFASESCRDTFKSNESAYFLTPSPAPRSSEAERAAASQALAKFRSQNGADAPRENVQWTVETKYQDGGKSKIWRSHAGFFSGKAFAQWEQWDAGLSFFSATGSASAEGKVGDVAEMHPGERRELLAQIIRHPLSILLSRSADPVKLEGNKIVMRSGNVVFRVVPDGVNRIGKVEFRDRFAGPIADVSLEFEDYRLVEGVTVPFAYRARVNGGKPGPAKVLATVQLEAPRPDFLR